jgi:hypothetical protein
MSQSITQTLYEQDFSLWVKDTVQKLKAKNTENLDWGHLIISRVNSPPLGAHEKSKKELQYPAACGGAVYLGNRRLG